MSYIKLRKLMKIFFSKCPKSVSTPFFCISKSFGYFYQRKIIHNIGMCVQNWHWVIFFLTHCWSKPSFDSTLLWKRLFECGWCSTTCQHNRYDIRNIFYHWHFSSSISWNVLQILQKPTGAACLNIVGKRWTHFLIDSDRNLHRNWLLKLSIPLMNQLCWWLSKAGLQRFWISLMQAVQIVHWWHWRLRKELENTLLWNSCGLLPGDKHCSQALLSQ